MSVYRSRIPVVSAVGHETDFTLCDMAADLRAPTPSAAAELCIPARDDIYSHILSLREGITQRLFQILYEKKAVFEQYRQFLRRDLLMFRISHARSLADSNREFLKNAVFQLYKNRKMQYNGYKGAIENLSPISAFERGYSVAMYRGTELRSINSVGEGDEIEIILKDGSIKTRVIRSISNA